MSITKRTVLITGCSNESGLGANLAIAFHKAGLHVIATARNASTMKKLAEQGIETMALDVESESSISTCVSQIPQLDILVNNAGAMYYMPVTDISIAQAKKIFDLNVWSHIAVTQAFIPLIVKSPRGMIVNQTSAASVTAIPFQSVYSASKAALAMLSATLRLELQPFGIAVVDLRTGGINTGFLESTNKSKTPSLPESSIYQPVKEPVERVLRREGLQGFGPSPEKWAKDVVQDLLRKHPPPEIWRGELAWFAWFATKLPSGMFDGIIKKFSGMDVVEKAMQK
ncbi:uncharacterized protein KY384_003443 [Bacidia gigantensis]|uniref:uncharacterized protein n=1 Tax=Bacidia gigantensis TaxID=2732470 RepID=UPI001D0412C8|nr:uncharacterized protein KY384_003443 [Bacidia gigantensis]KAG8531807.1 hypothetical protein KY384_003443 [Bacidia gigantensis]